MVREVCGLDDGDDRHDEAVWLKANVGPDTILSRTYLREQVKEADAIASSQNLILRLNFWVWTQQSTKWLDLDDWDDCEEPLANLEGEECFGGLDLASTTDLAAFVLWFPGRRVVIPFGSRARVSSTLGAQPRALPGLGAGRPPHAHRRQHH